MVKMIEFSEGILSLTVDSRVRRTPSQCDRRIKLNFGEGRALTERHGREFMDFVQRIDLKAALKIENFVLELLSANTGVCWIDLDFLYSRGERL